MKQGANVGTCCQERTDAAPERHRSRLTDSSKKSHHPKRGAPPMSQRTQRIFIAGGASPPGDRPPSDCGGGFPPDDKRVAGDQTPLEDPRVVAFRGFLAAIDAADWKAGLRSTRELRALGLSVCLTRPTGSTGGGRDGAN